MIIISADDDPQTVAAALRYGAQGFVPKSTEAGRSANVEAVLAGEIYTPMVPEPRAATSGAEDVAAAWRIADLTPQQFRVLAMLCDGLQDRRSRLKSTSESDRGGTSGRDPPSARCRDAGTQAVLAAGANVAILSPWFGWVCSAVAGHPGCGLLVAATLRERGATARQVGPGTEPSAGAGHDHDADVVVGIDLVERVDQLTHHPRR